jgi:hypothetical protein
MGSTQSKPSAAAKEDGIREARAISSTTNNNINANDTTTGRNTTLTNDSNNNNRSKMKRTISPENESGYAKAERICRKKKRVYDACYTAALSIKEEDCEELFDVYRACFLRVLTKDMEKRGVKVKSGSMIGEYKDEVGGT